MTDNPRPRTRNRRSPQLPGDAEVADFENEIIREASRQREHELQLAQVAANRERDLARIARDRAEHRHTALGWTFGGGFAAAVVIVLILVVNGSMAQDRANRESERVRRHEQQVQLAETCIREGNIWVDGDCLLARREQP